MYIMTILTGSTISAFWKCIIILVELSKMTYIRDSAFIFEYDISTRDSPVHINSTS